MEKIVSIDVSTSSIKFLHQEGRKQIHHTVPLTSYRDDQGYWYQKPEEILTGIKDQLAHWQANGQAIDVISLSVPMHTLIIGNQMLLWSDTRSDEWVKNLQSQEDCLAYYQATGTPVHPMTPFAKIGYLKARHLVGDQVNFYGLKEYLMLGLTGQPYLDYSTASTTGLFNLEAGTWDDAILAKLQLEPSQLGILCDTDAVFPILESIAQELDLDSKTQVHVGACDGCLASYAAWRQYKFCQVVSLGTSGAVRRLHDDINLSPDGRSFCYYLRPDCWVTGGPTNNGGNVILWWIKLLFPGETELFKTLDHILYHYEPTKGMPYFHPYLYGERAPFWDASMTASLTDLQACHGREDILYSVVTGVVNNLVRIAQDCGVEGSVLTNGGLFHIPSVRNLFQKHWAGEVFSGEDCEPCNGLIYLYQDTRTN